MLFEKKVEVISVVPATEGTTGEYIYQVTFGQVVEVDEELRRTIPAPANSKPPKKIATTTILIFFDASKTIPYKVGSKWNISIEDNGTIIVRETK
jgi:hypothetical protein